MMPAVIVMVCLEPYSSDMIVSQCLLSFEDSWFSVLLVLVGSISTTPNREV